jgi:hypothetical protein
MESLMTREKVSFVSERLRDKGEIPWWKKVPPVNRRNGNGN